MSTYATASPLKAAVCFASILLAAGTTAVADEPRGDIPAFARERPAVKTGEPIFAFNGKDLTGFYVYTHDHHLEDPNHVFGVENGLIRVSGEEFGGFATKQTFKNYQLVVEWKWGKKTWPPREKATRDSGILLHCVGPDGAAGGHWLESIECQLIEGGCGDFIMVQGNSRPSLTCEVRLGANKQLYYEKGGKAVRSNSSRFNWWGRDPNWTDTIGFRGGREVENPSGEWNRMEVVCDGSTITNILNGYVVNVGTESSLTEGKIQFQSEGAEILFRKIEIRPLLK